ncbi:MAG: FtsX-like permease family protein [Bradymonadaceae bacterium]
MSYESFIGLRYLMAKQRSRVVSVITLISIAGVALGVTAMIVVLSVMGGFKKDLKEKILGTKAHIVVTDGEGGTVETPDRVVESAESFEAVTGAAPFIDGEVMVSSPTNLNGMKLRGIDPEAVREVSDLESEVFKGSLSYLTDPAPLLEKLESRPSGSGGSLLDEIERQKDLRAPPAGGAPSGDAGGTERSGTTGPDAGVAPDGAAGGEMSPPVPETPAGGEDGTASSDGAGTMPPIAGGETGTSEGASSDSNGGDMPSITGGDADGAETSTDGAGGMPPVLDSPEKGAATEGEGRQLPGIILGKELAKSLRVDLGDEVTVVTPEGEMGPTGPLPNSRPFRVVGLFYTGMYKYDANYGYTTLKDARDFLGMSGVTGVELKTRKVERALTLSDKLASRLPDRLKVQDWKEMNRSLFYALRLEKIAMFVVLAFIILVASFSIIAMLIMIVIEKKRDISVLKSMGVTDGGIMRIFMIQGVVIGGVGAAIGLVLGLSICWALIEFGFPLNSEVYYISTLPVQVDPIEVGLVVLCTIAISFLATIYPSRKAADLPPVEGLRYE